MVDTDDTQEELEDKCRSELIIEEKEEDDFFKKLLGNDNILTIRPKNLTQLTANNLEKENKRSYEKIKEVQKGKREEQYTQILKSYVGLNKFKNFYRHVTYLIVFSIFIIFIAVSIWLLIRAFDRDNLQQIISATASLLTGIIALPIIIVKYLYPKDDNGTMEKIIKHLIDLDSK